MKLQEGKSYKNRKGEIVGPLSEYDDTFYGKAKFSDGDCTYLENGEWAGAGDTTKDLIEEWRENENIFTSVKVLNQGSYRFFKIYEEYSGNGLVLDLNGVFMEGGYDEIKELANQLLEIAEYWGSK